MPRKAVPILILLAALSACVPEGFTRGAALLPATGPMAEAHAQGLRVVFTGATSGSGNLYITMPDGEKVSGPYGTQSRSSWDAAMGSGEPGGGGVAITPADWKALYGKTDLVAGQIAGEALCTGDRGTAMRVQYVVDPFNNTGFGVAKDNRGNLYRLKF